MPSPSARDLDYLDHLARESARFSHAVSMAAPDAPVSPCPDWNADDLLWHLAVVQWFWGTIIRNGVLTTEQSRGLDRPERPKDRAGADGIDEALRIMYGGDLPEWGRLAPGQEGAGEDQSTGEDQSAGGIRNTVRLRTTDTGDSWLVRLGQFSGTDPADGKSYDQPGIEIQDADPDTDADATISGSAADLDCWLWRRPALTAPDRTGDPAALAAFDAVIDAGID